MKKSQLKRMIREELLKESSWNDVSDNFDEFLENNAISISDMEMMYQEGNLQKSTWKEISKAHDQLEQAMGLYVRRYENILKRIGKK